jgi:hypothetical protein
MIARLFPKTGVGGHGDPQKTDANPRRRGAYFLLREAGAVVVVFFFRRRRCLSRQESASISMT